MGILPALVARTVVPRRMALVVAHPDDETIAAGGSLHLMPDLLLVHVTDGAPWSNGDVVRRGFATPAAYADAREAELQAALGLAGVRPRRLRLGVVDQEATARLAEVTDRLAAAFAADGSEAVLTHAYEGGHPDHDATACAVHRAAGRLGLPVFEFAGYHAGPGGSMVVQRFLPGAAETLVALPADDRARKRAMLDAFRTQAEILSAFDPAVERFRPAEMPDFGSPPHEGALNYENWGWAMTGARWRVMATGEMACAA